MTKTETDHGQADRHRVSLSKSALMLSPCIAWADASSKWYDDRFSDLNKRTRGTNVHQKIHVAESLKQSGNKLLLATLPQPNPEEDKLANLAIEYMHDVLEPRCELLFTEVAVGINWSKGDAKITKATNRNYPNWPGYQFGTADVLCHLKDGSLLVLDWKTGGTDGAKEQLLSLAYGFHKALNKPVKEVQCVQLIDGAVIPTAYPIIEGILDNHATSMMCQWEDIQNGTQRNPVAGIHCTQLYCPHLAHCQAVTGIVEETSNGEQAKLLLQPDVLLRRFRMTDRPSSAEEAGYTMSRVTASSRQNKYFTEAMKDYCRNGGRVLASGYEWKETGAGYRWVKQ